MKANKKQVFSGLICVHLRPIAVPGLYFVFYLRESA